MATFPSSSLHRLELNCDLGEQPDDVHSGAQERLLPFLARANIACGGHAGDDETMAATVDQCLRHGVLVGAHPSYPDRANFGRVSLALPRAALEQSLVDQVTRLEQIAHARGVRLSHLKPHGALYHDVESRPHVAEALLEVARMLGLPVVLFARSPANVQFLEAGIPVLGEAFADRRYEPDGTLRPRTQAGALLDDPAEAADQAARIAAAGWAETLCVHGDTPGALEILRAVHARLEHGWKTPL